MRESEIIKGVIDLLAGPENWIKHLRAKNSRGHSIDPTSPYAVSFCLGGAVMHVLDNNIWQGWYPGWTNVGDRFHRLAEERGFDEQYPFVDFNNSDDTSYEDMMLFLKEALYEAEANEAQLAIEANLTEMEA